MIFISEKKIKQMIDKKVEIEFASICSGVFASLNSRKEEIEELQKEVEFLKRIIDIRTFY